MENQEARQFTKLMANPVEISFKVGQEDIKAWLHCMTDQQTIHCISVYGEQYDLLVKDGQDSKQAEMMGVLASNCQLLVYAIHTGELKNSPRLFKRVAEVLTVSGDVRKTILETYRENFNLTEEDLGNSLRARIGS